MKKIYIYKHNLYAAIMAAYNTLNIPSPNDFQWENIREGYFYYLGIDKDYNEIYLLYSSKDKDILKNLIYGIANIYKDEVEVIDLKDLDYSTLDNSKIKLKK